jgi:chorismate-pyruvate lyase
VTRSRTLLAVATLSFSLLSLASPGLSREVQPVWPDTPLARAGALALLQTLNAELLSHDSATLTLDGWCVRRALAPAGSKIVAERVTGQDKSATPEVRATLQVGVEEPVRYRRVRLRCGDRVLSEADNWYVPSRLTPAMNTVLDSSDTAFGRAVQALHFRRQTISATLLWSPLPEGWDIARHRQPARAGRMLAIPDKVIEHRAVLRLPDGTPFSQVVETYRGTVLGAPPPLVAGR